MKKIVETSTVTAPRGVGRPRSEATRAQILSATIRLLEERTVQAITIEAIAKEAGVGKATIYRWWDSKALVVIDAFAEHHLAQTPMPRDLPPGEAIAAHIALLIRRYAGWSGRIVAQIIAEGQADPNVLREWRERFHYGRRAIVRELLEEWRRTTPIPTPPNIETLAELLYAPLYLRLMLGTGPLDDTFAREHIGYVYSLLGVEMPELDEKPRTPKSRGPSRKTARAASTS